MIKRWAIFILGFCAVFVTQAQRIEVLTMEREGTAAVYLAERDKIACIIDGGRRGGLTKPRLEGKPVLQALLDQGYKELVISCSHPHDDHAAGLKEIVTSDPNIQRFENITFVDSEYATAESLYNTFRKANPSFPEARVRYSSAKSKNAFEGIFKQGSELRIENFQYTPEANAGVHGRSTIHHVFIEKDGKRQFFVDFDDADDSLIQKWAKWAREKPAERRPDISILPHHNADTVNMEPLLDPEIRPKKCIVTANSRNKFLHPGPVNFEKWVEAVGAENVLVTGAHENIVVTEKGVETVNDAKARQAVIDSILKPMKPRIDAEVAAIQEEATAAPLTKSQSKRLETLSQKSQSVETLIERFGGGHETTTWSPPIPSPSYPKVSSTLTADARAVGAFVEQRATFERAVARVPSVHPTTSVGRLGRVAKFSAALGMFPIRGGVILGNAVDKGSAKVKKAEISLTNDLPEILLTVEQDGVVENCVFDGLTRNELAAAYDYVKPSVEIAKVFKVDETENGIVGKSGNLEGHAGWKFGVHPAIAGTLIARDAMRLDMSISVSATTFSNFNLPKFQTYQWYDAPAVIRAKDGALSISARSQPEDYLLRIRFWTNGPLPSWVSSSATIKDDFTREALARFRERVTKHSYLYMTSDKQEELIKKIAKELTAELQAETGGNATFNDTELIKKMSRFDAFRKIERFARLVAVLHWISETCPTGLPARPESVRIQRYDIPAELKYAEVQMNIP